MGWLLAGRGLINGGSVGTCFGDNALNLSYTLAGGFYLKFIGASASECAEGGLNPLGKGSRGPIMSDEVHWGRNWHKVSIRKRPYWSHIL